MIYNGTLLKIDGKTIPFIKSFKVGRNKLWKDADRNMSGDVRATLIGIFPKIQLEIGYTTQEILAELTEIFDKDYFEVEWFDVRIQAIAKAKYYANDYEVEMYSKPRGIYSPFSVNLIPVSKRKYT